MLDYSIYDKTALIFFGAITILSLGALITQRIVERIRVKRKLERQREKQYDDVCRERNFYRLQCEVQGILREYENGIAFDTLRREAGLKNGRSKECG